MTELSWLRRTTDGVVEAGCLVAAVAVPLYFSVLTPTAYEADKAAFLRVLATVVGAAWLIGLLERHGRASVLRREPFLWAAVVLFVFLGIGTAFSIDPRLSLWGSQGRQQGLWTRIAYLVLLIAVADRFRHERSRGRLLSMLILGAVPAVAYGFVQQFGLDPIPSSGDPNTINWPVRSTFGQHIFFASYLVLIIPLTAARALQTWRERPAEGRLGLDASVMNGAGILLAIVVSFFAFMNAGFAHPALFAAFPFLLVAYVVMALFMESLPSTPTLLAARPAAYGLLLAFELVVLAFSGARGAWLGFFASVPVFAILLARRLDRPRIVARILGVAAVLALFLVLLNVPNGPLQPLRTVHGISRLANITESGGADGSAQGRLLIWQGVKKLMTDDPSIGGTWGGPLRDLTGYGPESLHWAFNAVYPLKLRQVTSEIWTWDRAHNIYLDYLVDAGVVSLLAFVALLALLFWRIWAALPRVSEQEAWLLIGTGAAVAGHMVDGFFGIEIVATAFILWVLFGLVAGAPDRAETVDMIEPVVTTEVVVGAVAGVAALMVVAAILKDQPALLSALWVLSIASGTGLVASCLTDVTMDLSRFPRLDRRQIGLTAAVLVLGVIALGSQSRFETAAIADAAGLRQLTAQPLQALGLLQEAARNDGEEPKYQTDLGGAYEVLGAARADSADPTYQPTSSDTVTLDPTLAANLGQAQLYRLAELSLRSADGLSPLDPDVHNNLGTLYLQLLNQPGAALQQFRQAERLSVDNPRYLDQEAQAQLQQKQEHAAAARAQQALNLDTTFWYSYYTLAMVDHELGIRQGARQAAALSLYWVKNFWPPPPSTQISQLQAWQREG